MDKASHTSAFLDARPSLLNLALLGAGLSLAVATISFAGGPTIRTLKAVVVPALLVTAVAILLAGPAGAQSYDPDIGSGNIVRPPGSNYWARYRAPARYWAQPVYWRTYGRVYPRYGWRAYR